MRKFRFMPAGAVVRSLVFTLALWPGAALAERYEIVVGDKTEVVFESHAPMEKFKGRTGQVQGWLEVDLDDLTSPVELVVEVDLASFDTGKGKRNRHMRENHLETDKYPAAFFRGGQVSEATASGLAVGGTVALKLTGTLDLHGVTREMTCEVTLQRPAAAELLVEARFVVLLPDHKIERPKFLIMKLGEDQKVTAQLSLKKES